MGWYIPREIASEEKIVRVVTVPSHIDTKKNKLKNGAFRSQVGTDEVSVIRHDYMGSDFCKAKGIETKGDTYVGLAVIKAQSIRDTTSTLHDSREEFCGHAHISHGVILPPNEPLDSHSNLIITSRCQALVKATIYHPDPDIQSNKWVGPEL